VAALAPRAELEGQMGDSHVGLQARLMSQAMRKLTAAISKSKTCCVFTNQIREKIGVMFGSPETTPGGRAFGIRAKVKVVKNKVAPPFGEAEFDILYAEGISWTGSVIDAAIQADLIEKRGSWLSFDGKQLGQGREASRDTLKNDPELEKLLLEKIREKAQEAKA
jgi:recombination protein RecA